MDEEKTKPQPERMIMRVFASLALLLVMTLVQAADAAKSGQHWVG
jgi:hypothetical protein